MVTEDGLEDQLLALTVSKERPDLEEQKAEIIQSNNDNKIKATWKGIRTRYPLLARLAKQHSKPHPRR